MRKKVMYSFILTILLLTISAKINTSEVNKNSDYSIFDHSLEIKKMQSEFEENIGSVVLDENYSKFILADATERILNIEENNQSQYFVYVDRNPKKQIVLVCLYNSVTRNITIIGADKISTGDSKQNGHFITPTGIFENNVKNPSYRALGTKNDKGWRGFGVKNNRVWDFGWQETAKHNQMIEIRLLMHATDPVFGEKRLGRIDSKGCIRISAKLNKFLDHYGILDKNYEEYKHLKTVSWLLAVDREPTSLAGKYLFIGDSEIMDNPSNTTLNHRVTVTHE